MKNTHLSFLAGFLLMPAALAAANKVPAPKPNFVVILIDDMGCGDIAPFGSTKCKTPALDRMAREGLKLTSFYAAPVCSASRAQPDFFPTRYGFDHYFGLPYSNDMLPPEAGTGEDVVPLMRDKQVVALLKNAEEDQLVRLYTEEAVKFIQANHEHPFFLYLPHSAVHFPIHPRPEFRNHSEDEYHKGEHKPGLRLYNLAQDTGETTDVSAQHPDVVKRLKALADKMAATLCDGSAKGRGVRPPGRVDNPQFLYQVNEGAKKKSKKSADEDE